MMNKLKTALTVIFGGSAAIVLMFLQSGVSLMGTIIHIVTILIAYRSSGALAAIITAFLPVLSQIYWIFKLWTTSGTFFTPFAIVCLIYAGIFLLPFIVVLIIAIAGEIFKQK